MSQILLVTDYCSGQVYAVLEFANTDDVLKAEDIIRGVKESRPCEWCVDDIWDALSDSGIKYEDHYFEEYGI